MTAQSEFIEVAHGVRMPRILYGTAWKQERTEALVASALALGFRGVDTACQPKHYHEAGVGAALASGLGATLSRADLYVQTKFTPLSGQDPARVPYDAAAPLGLQVAQSFQASVRNLQTPYVDALLLHSPLRNVHELHEVWQALETVHDAGGARALGISNCYDADVLRALYQWARIKPVVVQNRFYAETGYDAGIRAFCRRYGLLYQSFWTLTANPALLAHRVVQDLARAYERSSAQILFRFLTQCEVVPLTGTQSSSHMREDLQIFEFALEPRELAAIDALLS